MIIGFRPKTEMLRTESVVEEMENLAEKPCCIGSATPPTSPVTGKSFSEAPILASVNPQYDKRLFIEFPEKYKFTSCWLLILF